jgi:hypothetical protein
MRERAATPAWKPATPARDVEARLTALALVLIGIAGLWFRLRNLGALPLVGDEAIQALSLQGLLEHGIPEFETGFVYTRALLFSYLQAIPGWLLGAPPDAFWLRLPGAVCGALLVFPVYALAREFGDRRVALLAVLLVGFSSWEIELSRYARFYILFQLAFIASVYYFFRGFVREEPASRYAFLASALVCFFTHNLSFALFTLFAIPLAGGAWYRLRTLVPWAGLLGVFWYVARFTRRWLFDQGAGFDPAPAMDPVTSPAGSKLLELIRPGLPNLYLPGPAAWQALLADQPVLAWGILLVSLACAGWVAAQGARRGEWVRALLCGIAILLAACYQFSLAVLLLIVQVVWSNRDWRGWRSERTLRVTVVICSLLLVFWLAVLVQSGAGWKTNALILFGVPNMLQYFFFWLVLGWPILSLVLAVTSVLLVRRFLADRHNTAIVFMPAVILVPAVCAAFFQSYHESRYVFHLYPLMLVLFAVAAVSAADAVARSLLLQGGRMRGILFAILVPLALVLSQDASPVVSWRIADRDFRSERDPMRSIISWPLYAGFHADRESPAEYVSRHRSAGDKVLALGPIFMQAQFHYYSGGTTTCLNTADWPDAYGRWRDGRMINYLTGAEIIAGAENIRSYVAAAPAEVWILGDSLLLDDENEYYSPEVKDMLRQLTAERLFRGRDGYSFVARTGAGNQAVQIQEEN